MTGGVPPPCQVRFEPDRRAIETVLVEYEWRETLCRMNVISCGQAPGCTHKRRLNNYGFVPAVGAAIKVQAPILSRVQQGRTLISEARGLTVKDRNYCN
jgi:hypothetical protein